MRNRSEFFQTCGMEIFMNVIFYVVLVFLFTYQEVHLGFTADRAALLSTLASVLGLIIVPISGWLSDKVGRKPVLMGGAAIAQTVFRCRYSC